MVFARCSNRQRTRHLMQHRLLRLYVEKSVMDSLREEDTQRYKMALEATGGVFGGIEPVHRFYEAFQGTG